MEVRSNAMIYVPRYQALRHEQGQFYYNGNLQQGVPILYNVELSGTSTRPTLLSFTGPQYDPHGDLQQGAPILYNVDL
jgi:hypothetical protein